MLAHGRQLRLRSEPTNRSFFDTIWTTMTGLAFFIVLTGLIVWQLRWPRSTPRSAVVSASKWVTQSRPARTCAVLARSTRDALQRERPYMRAIAGFAAMLTPIWLILIIDVLCAILDLFRTSETIEAENLRWHYLAIGSMLLAFGGLVTAPLALIRVWTAERQTHTVEQGHVTDRLTKAIEQLGAEKTVQKTHDKDLKGKWDGTGERFYTTQNTKPNIEVRLGAIYALERIAQDSERDHIPVMETLCAYVRENAQPHDLEYVPPPRADIQAVMDVVNRRSDKRIAMERLPANDFRLNLDGACLQRANLRFARMEGADLRGARLERADLRGARLEGAYLIGALLERADLSRAHLERASLIRARLERANLSGARLARAGLIGTRLGGAMLAGARLEGAALAGARLERAVLSGARLERANLGAARLERADLEGARFQSANLSNWSCAGASLRSAELSATLNLDPASVRSAFGVRAGIGRTILPEGMDYPEHWHVAADASEDGPEHFEAYHKAYEAWLATLDRTPSA